MCTTCGCGEGAEIIISNPNNNKRQSFAPIGVHQHGHNHDAQTIKLEQDILATNNNLAKENRDYFHQRNILALNLVSSPGSGKTSLLERSILDLRDQMDIYVIEGDQQTSNDADRINATKAPVVQINTGQGCHLDSKMIKNALNELNPKNQSVVFIENVGNLVCPALFDLGEQIRVVIISTTEGDDKPLKYPDMFYSAQLCIINKTDLLPYVDFDMDDVKANALKVNHHLEFIDVSARNGEGMEQWYDYLLKRMAK
jgi:hydrogenase nickel incorporation protein HypB